MVASIKVRSHETVDPFEVGKHYTGVDVSLSNYGSKFRYGFVVIYDSTNILMSRDEVVLALPPEALNEEEPAATTITHTQNSGKFIERRGQLTKNIIISGTTGYNFSPKLLPIARQFLPQKTIIEQEGPNSGMGRFLQLRNLFRKYWEIFSDDANKPMRLKNPLFLFINEKDDETWIVEPMSFKMVRQSPRNKFTYHYEIVLSTIALADNVLLLPDTTTLFEKVSTVRGIVGGIANDLTRLSANYSGAMSFATGALKEAADRVAFVTDTISSNLGQIADSVISVVQVPDMVKGVAERTANTFMGAIENFYAVGEEWTALYGKDPVPFEAYQWLSDITQLVSSIAGREELYSTPFSEIWKSSVLPLYKAEYGFGGFNDTLLAGLTSFGVRDAEILPNDDLVTIAVRELGDAERFQDLAILNNLKPPYVSPTPRERLPNTLAPGDPILIPITGSAEAARASIRTNIFTDPTFTSAVTAGGAATITVDTNGKDWRTDQWSGFTVEIVSGTGAGQSRKVTLNGADTITVDKNWTTLPSTDSVVRVYLVRTDSTVTKKASNEQLLGVDIQLENNDVKASSKGDISLVSGNDNMIQAIRIKLDTKPGELTPHPGFGLAIEPGMKAEAGNLLAYKVAVKQTLLSDKRINDAQQLQIRVEKDIINLKGYVLLAGGTQPFALDVTGGQ